MRHLAVAALLAPAMVGAQSQPLLFHDVRLFDGAHVAQHRDVLVRDGRIASLGASIGAPPGAQIIDGARNTLMPGLIDTHTHAWADALSSALVFGVTTELDMFTDCHWAAQMRAEQRAGNANARADL